MTLHVTNSVEEVFTQVWQFFFSFSVTFFYLTVTNQKHI
jgi:hypothetical protein